MVLVHNAPAAVQPFETLCEPKVQRLLLTFTIDVGALSFGSGEGHVCTGGNFNFFEGEEDRPRGVVIEESPGSHVGVETS